MTFDPFQGRDIRPGLIQRAQLFIINHPWVCIFFSLAWVIVSGLGLQYVEINNDSRAMFADDNPGLQRLLAVEEQFSKDDNVIIIVSVVMDMGICSRSQWVTTASVKAV